MSEALLCVYVCVCVSGGGGRERENEDKEILGLKMTAIIFNYNRSSLAQVAIANFS